MFYYAWQPPEYYKTLSKIISIQETMNFHLWHYYKALITIIQMFIGMNIRLWAIKRQFKDCLSHEWCVICKLNIRCKRHSFELEHSDTHQAYLRTKVQVKISVVK